MTLDAATDLAGVPYVRHYVAGCAPAVLDHVALQAARRPSRAPDRPYRHLDLGCGYGTTSLLLAAAAPDGAFVGLDADGDHVRDAAGRASAAGLANASFLHATFEDALEGRAGDPGLFDYITAYGVLSWVSEADAARVFALIDRHLAPGGAVCLGYNAQPGWAAVAPLRRLMIEHASRLGGDEPADARAAAGIALARELADAGARGLRHSPRLMQSLARAETSSARYLAHEFLAAEWRAFYATEMLARASTIGLERVGSTQLIENRADFCLRKAERAIITREDDPAMRELLSDICRDATFRTDVFMRAAPLLDDDEAAARRLDGWIALTVPPERVKFSAVTEIGALKFDNEAARAIVAAIADGPAPLRSAMTSLPEATRGDWLNACDALFASEQVIPVDPPAGDAATARLNAQLLRDVGGAAESDALATRFGVGVTAPRAILAFLTAPPDADAAALISHAGRLLEAPVNAADADDFLASGRRLLSGLGII